MSSKIFENKDKENQKNIEKLQANITEAEGMIENLSSGLSYDTDIEKYSEISVRINSYKEFIQKNKEQIEHIINNPYSKDDCIKRTDEIQKKYNAKFRKIYSDIVKQINDLSNSLGEYKEVTNSFLNDRNTLNANASKIDFTVNVYEGEGIKNDYYFEYKEIDNNLKKLVSLYKLL